jgi:hypothetical protein
MNVHYAVSSMQYGKYKLKIFSLKNPFYILHSTYYISPFFSLYSRIYTSGGL